MTQATGALSKLLLGFESTFQTPPADGFVMSINSSDLKSTRNQITPATIRGDLNPVEPSDGNTSVAGSISVPVDSIAFWYWLKAAFGDPVTTGTGPYVHEFKAGNIRPTLTLEHQFLNIDSPRYFRYVGCKVSAIAISAGDDGELVATFSIVGTSETIETSSFDATPTVVSFSRLKNNQLSLNEGGSPISNAKLVDMNIDFTVDTDEYVIGSGGVLGSVPDGVMAISGNLNTLFEDVVLLNKAINSTESSLEMTFSASATSILVIKFPEVKYTRNSPGIEGPQGLAISLPFGAYYTDAPEATSVVATLTNSEEHA